MGGAKSTTTAGATPNNGVTHNTPLEIHLKFKSRTYKVSELSSKQKAAPAGISATIAVRFLKPTLSGGNG